MWGNKIYYLIGQSEPDYKLSYDQIDSEIGELKRIKESGMPQFNGEANIFLAGNKIYKIKNISENDSVAISYDGEYYKCSAKE